mmetsp:Transcript_4012/g.15488  ORF Transcript_4012/g.15488 Transcript_4012/m.15488 type:complete len:215 (-) Transcript_4012:724-1368(-)
MAREQVSARTGRDPRRRHGPREDDTGHSLPARCAAEVGDRCGQEAASKRLRHTDLDCLPELNCRPLDRDVGEVGPLPGPEHAQQVQRPSPSRNLGVQLPFSEELAANEVRRGDLRRSAQGQKSHHRNQQGLQRSPQQSQVRPDGHPDPKQLRGTLGDHALDSPHGKDCEGMGRALFQAAQARAAKGCPTGDEAAGKEASRGAQGRSGRRDAETE